MWKRNSDFQTFLTSDGFCAKQKKSKMNYARRCIKRQLQVCQSHINWGDIDLIHTTSMTILLVSTFSSSFCNSKDFFLINEKCEIYSNCRFIGSLCVLLVLIFSCQFRFLIVWATFIICYWSVGQFDGFCFDLTWILVEFLFCGLIFSWILILNRKILAVKRDSLISLLRRDILSMHFYPLNLFFSLNVQKFSLNALWFSQSTLFLSKCS